LRSPDAKASFPGQKRLAAAARLILTGVSPAPSPRSYPCRRTWEEIVDSEIPRLKALWADADALVINGEGTIHDDAIGALALLGLCSAAKRIGLDVALVNASIYGLSDWLLEVLKESVDFLSVREPLSREYLLSQGITASQSADCLFAAPHDPIESVPVAGTASAPIIYTPGVLAGGSEVTAGAVARDVTALAREGAEVHYLVVEEEDEWAAPVAAQAGAKVIPLGMIPWERMAGYLAGASCVVSGRYHINIFAMIAGVPFLSMETNTPKMKGLLRLVGAGEIAGIRQWNDGKAPDLRNAITIARDEVEKCRVMATEVLSGWMV